MKTPTRRKLHSTSHPPQMCDACGYVFDAAAPAFGNKRLRPRPGDMSICLNCSNALVLVGDRWHTMLPADWNKLKPSERQRLQFVQHTQRQAKVENNWPDLSKRDRRA